MKKSEIRKIDGKYQVVLFTGEFTPSGYPIYQEFTEKGLNEVLGALRRFYEEDNGAKKGSAGHPSGK